MVHLRKYDKTKVYVLPNMTPANYETICRDYPAASIDGLTFVIGTDETETTLNSFDMLINLRNIYGIDPALSEDEAIQAIEDIINTPPEEDPVASPEERIAACLEYQTMMSMPDDE